jgi:UDP-glucose 4-epimerase
MKKKTKGWTYSIMWINEAAYGQNVKVEIYSHDFKVTDSECRGTCIADVIYVPDSHPQTDLKKFLNSAVKLKIQLYLDRQGKKELLNTLVQTQRIPVK